MKIIAAMFVALVVPAVALAGHIAGSFQGWNPNDPAYSLTLDGNGVWVLTQNLGAGHHEYKAIDGDSWGLDFPWNNQGFDLAAAQDITWYVNLGATVGVKQGDEFVFHSPNPPIACGDFMSELGGSDWNQADVSTTVMSDPDGNGVWTFSAVIAPAGGYQFKVVLNNNWDQNTGNNIPFNSDGVHPVTFSYDMSNNMSVVSTEIVTIRDVTVRFHLCLADGIDSFFDVCVTGDHPELTNWGNGVLMSFSCHEASPKLYQADVLFPAGSNPYVEYKYRKDDCQTWEDGGNHSLMIDDSDSFFDVPWVDGWSWMTPDCPDCASPVEGARWGTIKAIYR